MEYVRCQNPACGGSNPVKEKEEDQEYTCIFCGQPFTLPNRKETEQTQDEETDPREQYIRDAPPVRDTIDQNPRKHVNRNKRTPLR
jgi:hypothetical protein